MQCRQALCTGSVKKKRSKVWGWGVEGPGCALGCRSPEVPATRRCGAAASGETEDGDVQARPASSLQRLGSSGPWQSQPRAEALPASSAGASAPGVLERSWDSRGRSSLHRAGDVRDPGSARGTQGSAAAGRTRHAAPGALGTCSAPPRAESQLALTGSPVSLAARPPTGCRRSDRGPPRQAVLSPLPDRATTPHPRPPATIGPTMGGAGRGGDVD